MKNFLASLWSKKLWMSIGGIGLIITGMATGHISVKDGFDKIQILILAYLASETAVKVTNNIKNGGK
jgi:formate-dependent nitrite reductase membrane component NrfD